MKKIFISLFLLLVIASGASLVFGNVINFEKEVSFIETSSKNIFPDDPNLNSVIVAFEGNFDISKAVVYSQCETETKFLEQLENKYYFFMTLKDLQCSNPYFSLKHESKVFSNSSFSLNIEKKFSIWNISTDYSTRQIESAKKGLEQKIQKYSLYRNLKENISHDYFSLVKKQRIFQELIYKHTIISSILDRRSYKYDSPVKGYKVPKGLSIIPNAGRPYRNDYTDGIHHGWDIIAPEGTPVSAIDDGTIIRVVRDFAFEDLSNIKKGSSLTHTEQLRNLDILRGNQIWLKTSKGDVIFYSHLKDVYEDIKEGDIVELGRDLGTIGVTGVPDKSYTNFHLHFPIHKNPYTSTKAGQYSMEDYMNWDWYLKGLSADEVIQGQKAIFSDGHVE